MSIQFAIFLGIQSLTIVLCSVSALASVYSRRRALQQETSSLMAGSSVQEAYQRFVAARFRTILTARRTNTYILLGIVVIFLLFTSIQQTSSDSVLLDTTGNPFTGILMFIPIFIALLIGLFIGTYVLDVAGTLLVDQEAHQIFQLDNFPQEMVIQQKIRAVLLKLVPLICYLEGIALVQIFLPNPLLLFFLMAISLIIYFVITQVFATTFYALGASLRPLEQTEWAYLGERITQWTRLGGVTFSSIQVEHDLIGTTNVRAIGLNHPMFVISEHFLRNSDWRQQDAMIAFGIGGVRTHLIRLRALSTLLSLILTALVLGFLLLIPLLSDNIFPLLSVAFLIWIAALVGRIYAQRALRNVYYRIDRNAAFLTGDPLAVMVMLNTIQALNGVNATTRGVRIPSMQDRLTRLDALTRQPWPRAPHAANRVPAVAPAYFAQHILTVPLDQDALTSQPAPVPTNWYATP